VRLWYVSAREAVKSVEVYCSGDGDLGDWVKVDLTYF
jgi:hypothetical protein